ncbi:baeRF3 domain-containing protein [Dyadobacter bucti]|uniref:baeRF3 domain-containing protein n=1 Tax=Dyadobacter bucti TaxID=2572203 RepID=UPI003F724E12
MKLPTRELIHRLSSISTGPCISIYMPTHRTHPDNGQDPIRFQNLLKELEASLSQKYSVGEVRSYLQPFENIKEERDVWNYNLDGLAVFYSKDVFELVRIPVIVTELVVVSDSFHTKPLRKYLQTEDRFQILGLSLHEMRLYEGNRHSVSEIELGNDVPKTIQDALGDELTEKHTTVASYGGVGGGSGNMHHGHGSKKDETDIDAERFFRVVADTVYEKFSKESELPLILAALPEHHNLFNKVNKNPFLLESGIALNPDALSADKLATMAWEVMEPEYNQRLKSWSEKAGQAIADQKGSDLISDIVAAATEGRVETLLIESDLILPGKIVDEVSGRVETGELSDPETDDLLDDIGEIVEKMGGRVLVIPADQMKFESGCVALYRY